MFIACPNLFIMRPLVLNVDLISTVYALGWWHSEGFVEYIYETWFFNPLKSPRLRPQKDFLIGCLLHVSQDNGPDPKILC